MKHSSRSVWLIGHSSNLAIETLLTLENGRHHTTARQKLKTEFSGRGMTTALILSQSWRWPACSLYKTNPGVRDHLQHRVGRGLQVQTPSRGGVDSWWLLMKARASRSQFALRVCALARPTLLHWMAACHTCAYMNSTVLT